MSILDEAVNFAKVTLLQGYSASATTVQLVSGDGAKLPAVPFNAVWWDSSTYGDPSDDPNREIVRVTGRSGDVLTITRGQETTYNGLAASTKNTSGSTYQMIAGLTALAVANLNAAAIDTGTARVWVTENGAVGDGSTDDTTAFQTSIDNGSEILIPAGTWIIADIALKSNLTIRGAGRGITTLKLKNSAGAVNMLSKATISNLLIEDLTLDGNKSNNATALDCLNISSASYCLLRNVSVTAANRHGINIAGDDNIVDKCLVTSCDSDGYKFDGDRNALRDSKTTSCDTGVEIVSGSTDTTLRDCYVTANVTAVDDSGTSTHASNVVGWVTAVDAETSDQDGTTGANGFNVLSITHGLDVTPAKEDCQISIWVNGTPDGLRFSGWWVESVGALAINVGYYKVASNSSALTWRFVARINTRP